jgi:hypothetical protein
MPKIPGTYFTYSVPFGHKVQLWADLAIAVPNDGLGPVLVKLIAGTDDFRPLDLRYEANKDGPTYVPFFQSRFFLVWGNA